MTSCELKTVKLKMERMLIEIILKDKTFVQFYTALKHQECVPNDMFMYLNSLETFTRKIDNF